MRRFLVPALGVATCLCNVIAHAQSVWFVDADAPGGSGTSWSDAFGDLQPALASAGPGDEIWVAEGVYFPAPPDGSSTATFQIPSGVAVYGGFIGNETLRDQRDPAAHETRLSGDLNQDDTFLFIHQPNSQHVITINTADAATRLDGFSVSAGVAYQSNPPVGGGLFVQSGDPTIANCHFGRSYARQGGIAYASDGSPVFENCEFDGGIASDYTGAGGGLYIGEGTNAMIKDCLFTGNEAEGNGSRGHGGGLYTAATSSVRIEDCEFFNNFALGRGNAGNDWSRGGAVYCQGNTALSRSSFTRNTSNVGGAVQSWTSLPLQTEVLNCTFKDNSAIAVSISGQEQGGAGGAIVGGDELSIIGTVVYGGDADNYGGAWVGDLAKVSGSIFWGNTDGNGNIGRSQIRTSGDVEYSCVENMLVGEPGEDPPDPEKFPGSIASDPRFVNASIGNFRLQSDSPCIDAADNTAWPAWVITDLDGNTRFYDDPNTTDTGVGPAPIVDMGAYEFGAPQPCRADFNGDGSVDTLDFLAFLNVWSAGDTLADWNGDGSTDTLDFLAFLNDWVAGCG